MEIFLEDLEKKITQIFKDFDNPNVNSEQKYQIDLEGLNFIKQKDLNYFEIFFVLLKEKINNLKSFIKTELDGYYKNDLQTYPKYLSFQKFILEQLDNYLQKEKINKDFRENKQDEYVGEIIKELNLKSRVFVKAPTGFGKTVLYYKTIAKLNVKNILIFTPRLLLNQQIVESKYLGHIGQDNFKIIHYSSNNSPDKEKKIKKIAKYIGKEKRFICTSCYQSKDKLLTLISKYKIKFDLIIFDEAHVIETWKDSEFVKSNEIGRLRIFGSATPTSNIESEPEIFGKVIEMVKVYELIDKEILCNIVTLVKKLDNKKKEYHNLKDLVLESMCKYNKKKGIIYVNTHENAKSLYELIKTQNKINQYIFISGSMYSEQMELEEIIKIDHDSNISNFESDTKPSVIIVVGKISYGYDNPLIDFLVLGDPRQSDIEIRQILGRGLRWNKSMYPDKLLHLLVPLYQDEFGNYPPNSSLKKYLDYIIGECGQDIIYKSDGFGLVCKSDKSDKLIVESGKDYTGANIPSDILQQYCTTGYNKYSDFMRFLQTNKIFGESDYNKLWEKNKMWMCGIGELKKKYPKFSFQQIHPDKNKYYLDKNEAIEKYQLAKNILKKQIGSDKFADLMYSQQIKKIIQIDDKIPPVNIDLYYADK
jgi:superfamily II DNA or RNA helicase